MSVFTKQAKYEGLTLTHALFTGGEGELERALARLALATQRDHKSRGRLQVHNRIVAAPIIDPMATCAYGFGVQGALQLLLNCYGSIRFAQIPERVLIKSFVVLIKGTSKSNHFGVQGTFKGYPDPP